MRVLSWLALIVVLLMSPVAAQDDGDLAPAGAQEGEWIAALRGTVDVEGGLMRLAAQREGLIAEVLVKEGDRVEAGQILARIDDSATRLQVRAAELELDQSRHLGKTADLKLAQAEAELRRLATMASVDAVPRKQIDEATRARDLAQAEAEQSGIALALAENRLAIAQLEITAREIRAPVAGVILRSSARVGDATTTNTVTEMFLLAPDGDRVLKGLLDEQFVGKVKPGQDVVLISERDAEVSLAGEVLRIAPVFGTPGQSQQGQQGQAPSEASGVEIFISIKGEEAEKLILGERLVARIKP